VVADLSSLVRLEKSQIKPAAEVLARAFQDYPIFVHFITDTSRRRNRLHYLFRYLVRFGVLYGEVYATSLNLEGVAVWLPSPEADLPAWRMIRSGSLALLFQFGWEAISRQLPVADFMSAIKKRNAPFPHWFLQTIGVDPVFQGKGHASALLKPALARIDEEGLPCYLDTEVEENVAIYQHYEFRVIEQAVIPGTDITIWAMLREARLK